MAKLLNVAKVKEIVKENERRISAEALDALNAEVERMVTAVCRQHNGGKKTIDGSLVRFVMGK